MIIALLTFTNTTELNQAEYLHVYLPRRGRASRDRCLGYVLERTTANETEEMTKMMDVDTFNLCLCVCQL